TGSPPPVAGWPLPPVPREVRIARHCAAGGASGSKGGGRPARAENEGLGSCRHLASGGSLNFRDPLAEDRAAKGSWLVPLPEPEAHALLCFRPIERLVEVVAS